MKILNNKPKEKLFKGPIQIELSAEEAYVISSICGCIAGDTEPRHITGAFSQQIESFYGVDPMRDWSELYAAVSPRGILEFLNSKRWKEFIP